MTKVEPDRAFEVFSRHARDPALHHLGQVHAEREEDAVVFAYTLYDERRWEEMFIVPSTSMQQLIRPE